MFSPELQKFLKRGQLSLFCREKLCLIPLELRAIFLVKTQSAILDSVFNDFFNSTGSDGSGSDSWSEDEDPSFSEKPKIKREASERSSRARKRPSFFQEYENEEDNLDKILDEFEQEQVI